MGHPTLRQRASELLWPLSPDALRLAEDMVETMLDAPGAGLAAPQVGVSVRLIVYRVEAHRATGQPGDIPCGPTVLANPEVEPIGTATEGVWEGCLSLPGLRGYVERPSTVRLTARMLDGAPVQAVLTGFTARVVQHEVDHLDGILFPQRMKDLSLLAFQDELDRFGAGHSQAVSEIDRS